jgi:hypothetical protein
MYRFLLREFFVICKEDQVAREGYARGKSESRTGILQELGKTSHSSGHEDGDVAGGRGATRDCGRGMVRI